MLTFLMALLFVFFEDTSLATKLSMGIVVAFLGVTVLLLLYLEGERTVAGLTGFPQGWTVLTKALRSMGNLWPSKDVDVRWYLCLRRQGRQRDDSSGLPGPH